MEGVQVCLLMVPGFASAQRGQVSQMRGNNIHNDDQEYKREGVTYEEAAQVDDLWIKDAEGRRTFF